MCARVYWCIAPSSVYVCVHVRVQVYSTKLTESIHSVDGGFIMSPTLTDFIVHTFSGKVRLG